jgi:hypothetical protein
MQIHAGSGKRIRLKDGKRNEKNRVVKKFAGIPCCWQKEIPAFGNRFRI